MKATKVTKTTKVLVFLIFVSFGVDLSVATMEAQLPPTEQSAVDAYRRAFEVANGSSRRGQIEAALVALDAMRNALTRTVDGTQESVLERLSSESFTALERDLRPGIWINREEFIAVEPEIPVFRQLAARRGDRIDREFFDLLQATYPSGVFPVYTQQQTDVTGCTSFGDGSLTSSYVKWTAFQRRNASRYSSQVARELDAVVEGIGSTCACGGAETVRAEFESLRRVIADRALRAQVDERLAELRDGRSRIQSNCHSG